MNRKIHVTELAPVVHELDADCCCSNNLLCTEQASSPGFGKGNQRTMGRYVPLRDMEKIHSDIPGVTGL